MELFLSTILISFFVFLGLIKFYEIFLTIKESNKPFEEVTFNRELKRLQRIYGIEYSILISGKGDIAKTSYFNVYSSKVKDRALDILKKTNI
jgi:hypothetical protein